MNSGDGDSQRSASGLRIEYYDSLDAYRGFAMLGGILVHAAMAYIEPQLEIWPVRNGNGHIGFTLLLFAMHAFRLQAFFMMAGFFAGLLIERRGFTHLILNRLQRVGLPLLLGSVTLVPIIQALLVWGYYRRGYGGDSLLGEIEVRMPDYYGTVLEFFESGRFVSGFLWFHLWFLWYLLWIYAIWLIGESLWRWVTQTRTRQSAARSVVDRAAEKRKCYWLLLLPVCLSIPTVVTMLPMRVWQADSPTQVMPQWPIVAYYLVFFLTGRWLYARRDLLPSFAAFAVPQILLAIFVAAPVMLLFQMVSPVMGEAHRPSLKLPAIICYSMFTWMMVLGLLGLFQQYFNRPRPIIRYTAQSAYWQYLAHLPVIIALQLWIDDWSWPNVYKYVLVSTLTFVVMFVSYHYLVRYRWLGIILNGRRYLGKNLH